MHLQKKTKLFITFIMVMVNYSFLFSQDLAVTTRISDEYLINNKINNLESELLKYNSETESNRLYIVVDSISYENNFATAFCTIFNKSANSLTFLKNEKIKLKKDSKWEIDYSTLGSWYKILPSSNVKKKKNSSSITSSGVQPTVQSGSTFSINLLENSFIKVPFSGSLYEIGSDYTNSQLGVQLFSHDQRKDGAVIYDDSKTYKQIGFVIDTYWNRIIYGRQTGITSMGLRDFAATSQHPLTYMTSIAAKNDGSVFVADYASKQISRFVYNYLSNELTIPSNSVFLTSAKIQVPVDIELTHDGNYLFVCDIGSKSIKRFDMNGNLVTQFTGTGYTLNRPIFVQPRADVDEVYVIDNNTAGGYSLVRFDYNGNVLGNYYNFPQGSIPSDLSERWDRSIIVPDAGLNMIHIFGGYYNKYLCSYNGGDNQNQSMFTKLGRMPTMYKYKEDATGEYISNNIIAIDGWGLQTGFNRFYNGVDVFDLSDEYFSHDFSYEPFTFSLSSRSLCTFKVIRNRDNYTMLLDENVDRSAGLEQIYWINFAGYEPGTYKIIISAIPRNNSDYGSYAAQPVTKEYIVNYGNVLSGNVIFDESYTVDYDETLTIEAGSHLTFNNGASLIVNGTLDVNGTSSNKVVFDFISKNSSTPNGIIINSRAYHYPRYYYPKGIIDHAVIKNAYRGILVYEDLTLTNSEITNCTYGLYQYNSDYINVRNNNFHHNDNAGAYLYNSDGTFVENVFYYNYIGIECLNNSSPNLNNGYNEFNMNMIGVLADHSYPTLGMFEGCIDEGGYNGFDYSVDHHMHIENNSLVYAQKNWWNTTYTFIYVESGSQCYYAPVLLSNPIEQRTIKITPEEETFNKKFTPQVASTINAAESMNLINSKIADDNLGYNKNWSLSWKLLFARKLVEIAKYNSAAKVCEDILEQYPDSSLSYFALHLLHKARVKGNKKDDFKNYINTKAKLKIKKQLYGFAELLSTEDEKENKTLVLDNLKEKYKDTKLVESILYDKFMYFLNEENNLELAKATSEELGKLFSNSRLYISSQRHLGNDVKRPLEQQLAKANSEEITEEVEIPKTYELLGNYPNPFNPNTTISYALPYSSNVELTIYDITGKVVKVFNENGQSAGYQNIVWFGNN
ncbi:MAG: right-handed parallel beta-helix repeat-containing protein, partial [Bacteroidetes bacterium]|nr:right-handed parallel beta-helix repeat-containing protein [Bacteroidota bacterium]